MVKVKVTFNKLIGNEPDDYLEQVERTEKILEKIKNLTTINMEKEKIPDLRELELNFILHCNHIYDWIKNSESYTGKIMQNDIDTYVKSSINLLILRYLCNKTKHYRIDPKRITKSNDSEKYISMLWHAPNAIESIVAYNITTKDDVKTGKGSTLSFIQFADNCMNDWQNYIKENL